MTSKNEPIMLEALQRYFAKRLDQKGPSHEAVDWGSAERQQLVFRQMLRILEDPATGQIARGFSLLDYGCGYGALLQYLRERGFDFATYTGYDMTPAMIDAAHSTHGAILNGAFTNDENSLSSADYIIGSGLLSLKLDSDVEAWSGHVLRTLDRLWSLSLSGLAFNSLTSYSDASKMRPDLYLP